MNSLVACELRLVIQLAWWKVQTLHFSLVAVKSPIFMPELLVARTIAQLYPWVGTPFMM
jgi:hypothetical protein